MFKYSSRYGQMSFVVFVIKFALTGDLHMSLKITIMELLIPCEYSEQISCSYKFIMARNLHVKYKQFYIRYSFHDIFRCISISCLL